MHATDTDACRNVTDLPVTKIIDFRLEPEKMTK